VQRFCICFPACTVGLCGSKNVKKVYGFLRRSIEVFFCPQTYLTSATSVDASGDSSAVRVYLIIRIVRCTAYTLSPLYIISHVHHAAYTWQIAILFFDCCFIRRTFMGYIYNLLCMAALRSRCGRYIFCPVVSSSSSSSSSSFDLFYSSKHQYLIHICLHNRADFGPLTAEIVYQFGAPQHIITCFASCLRYSSDVDHRRPTKLCTMFGRLLGWYTIYTFSGAFAP